MESLTALVLEYKHLAPLEYGRSGLTQRKNLSPNMFSVIFLPKMVASDWNTYWGGYYIIWCGGINLSTLKVPNLDSNSGSTCICENRITWDISDFFSKNNHVFEEETVLTLAQPLRFALTF